MTLWWRNRNRTQCLATNTKSLAGSHRQKNQNAARYPVVRSKGATQATIKYCRHLAYFFQRQNELLCKRRVLAWCTVWSLCFATAGQVLPGALGKLLHQVKFIHRLIHRISARARASTGSNVPPKRTSMVRNMCSHLMLLSNCRNNTWGK